MNRPTIADITSGEVMLPEAFSIDNAESARRNSNRRQRLSRWFYFLCVVIAFLSVLVLLVLLTSIGFQGGSRLGASLLTNPHSELEPETAGMGPAIIGSCFVLAVCALMAIPLGIATALFLEEFRPKNKWLRILHGFIQLNIANLAGVPSIVYGLMGLTSFVYMFNVFGQIQVNQSTAWVIAGEDRYYQLMSLVPGQTLLVPQVDSTRPTLKVSGPLSGFDSNGNPVAIEVWTPGTPKPTDKSVLRRTVKKGASGGSLSQRKWYFFQLPFGPSFLAAGLTLGLVILPIVIISSQESLRAVSPALREASAGLGATTWQTTQNVCIPAAMPGILTGVILAMGRAIGEAAPILIVLGSAISKDSGPKHLMDDAVTMPLTIYYWAGKEQEVYQQLAAAGIIVLLVVLLIFNGVAIFLRQKMQQI
jgi:phosphate transport system permease protein